MNARVLFEVGAWLIGRLSARVEERAKAMASGGERGPVGKGAASGGGSNTTIACSQTQGLPLTCQRLWCQSRWPLGALLGGKQHTLCHQHGTDTGTGI